MTGNDVVLVETLALAVPMWLRDLRQIPGPRRTEMALRWARTGADMVASRGDILQFRSKARKTHTKECVERSGHADCDCLIGTAEVFNALAKGLAALALSPGGVGWLGLHWCVEHPAGCRTDEPWELGCSAHGWDEPDLPRLPRWAPFGGRPVVTVELPEVVAAGE